MVRKKLVQNRDELPSLLLRLCWPAPAWSERLIWLVDWLCCVRLNGVDFLESYNTEMTSINEFAGKNVTFAVTLLTACPLHHHIHRLDALTSDFVNISQKSRLKIMRLLLEWFFLSRRFTAMWLTVDEQLDAQWFNDCLRNERLIILRLLSFADGFIHVTQWCY